VLDYKKKGRVLTVAESFRTTYTNISGCLPPLGEEASNLQHIQKIISIGISLHIYTI